MDTYLREQDDVASLGIVFFSNNFIRALDEFCSTGCRPKGLGEYCDNAIASLHSLTRTDSGTPAVAGLIGSPDEMATLVTSIQRHFDTKTTEDAAKKLETIQRALGRIKNQQNFSEDLHAKINDVLAFFECIADNGLANSQRQLSGDVTEAERVWQHYAMS
jgi:hypothetical protein